MNKSISESVLVLLDSLLLGATLSLMIKKKKKKAKL